jgi:hypothetical protein
MKKSDVNPDSLATKTFFVTITGALLYVAVVFTFVIAGNRADEAAGLPKEREALPGQYAQAG